MEERWLSLALRMKIFRLGRLQFEPDEDRHVLHVHIPEGEPLDDAACGESFAIAEEFFGPEYTIFDCESWLLSPKLQKLLKPDSNILKIPEPVSDREDHLSVPTGRRAGVRPGTRGQGAVPGEYQSPKSGESDGADRGGRRNRIWGYL